MKIESIIKKIRLHPLYWTWTSDDDTIDVLVEIAKQKSTKKILELGTFTGYTTMKLLLHSSRSTSIETVDIIDHASEYFSLLSKEDASRVHFSEMPISEFFALCPQERRYDLVFLDADHTFSAVLSDLGNILRHLDSGSVVVFHDADSDLFPGVKQALVLFWKFFRMQMFLGVLTGSFEWKKITNKNGTPGGIALFRVENYTPWYAKNVGRLVSFFAHVLATDVGVTKNSLRSYLRKDIKEFGRKMKSGKSKENAK